MPPSIGDLAEHIRQLADHALGLLVRALDALGRAIEPPVEIRHGGNGLVHVGHDIAPHDVLEGIRVVPGPFVFQTIGRGFRVVHDLGHLCDLLVQARHRSGELCISEK